jgi:hypothetical protein
MATLAAPIAQPNGTSNVQYLTVNSSNLSTPTTSSSASTASSSSSCAVSSSNKQTNQANNQTTNSSPTANSNTPQLANEDYLNKKMAFIQNHINNLLIEITNLPEPWTYAVTEDGRVFFIKYIYFLFLFLQFYKT